MGYSGNALRTRDREVGYSGNALRTRDREAHYSGNALRTRNREVGYSGNALRTRDREVGYSGNALRTRGVLDQCFIRKPFITCKSRELIVHVWTLRNELFALGNRNVNNIK